MTVDFVKVWDEALEILQEEISPIGFKTYVEVLIPRLSDENTICFLAPSNYHIEVLSKKYLDLIQNTIIFLTKKNYLITFESKDGEEGSSNILNSSCNDNFEFIKNTTNSDIIQNKSNDEKCVLPTKKNLNFKYTFENYIVGSNNRFAHASAIAVSENPGEKYNPLFIYGGVGLGKTHLMQAIGNEIFKQNSKLNIIYTTGENFANELVSAIMNNNSEAFRNKYRKIDLLLIDDVQFLAGKEKCQEEFFHTFNALFESGKQIVLTSEKAPKEIKLLEERLKTRFEMGLAVDIQAPDYETRLAILRKKSEKERYIINDDILVKIASRVTSNIREIEGVFNKLVAYSSFTNNELTDSVVDNTIESILVKNTKILTSKLVIQVVCKFFNIRVEDILSEKRSNNFAFPRQIGMYLCREFVNMGFPQIGKDFGGKDHSTVMYSCKKISEEYKNNNETKELIEDIKKSLSING